MSSHQRPRTTNTSSRDRLIARVRNASVGVALAAAAATGVFTFAAAATTHAAQTTTASTNGVGGSQSSTHRSNQSRAGLGGTPGLAPGNGTTAVAGSHSS